MKDVNKIPVKDVTLPHLPFVTEVPSPSTNIGGRFIKVRTWFSLSNIWEFLGHHPILLLTGLFVAYFFYAVAFTNVRGIDNWLLQFSNTGKHSLKQDSCATFIRVFEGLAISFVIGLAISLPFKVIPTINEFLSPRLSKIPQIHVSAESLLFYYVCCGFMFPPIISTFGIQSIPQVVVVIVAVPVWMHALLGSPLLLSGQLEKAISYLSRLSVALRYQFAVSTVVVIQLEKQFSSNGFGYAIRLNQRILNNGPVLTYILIALLICTIFDLVVGMLVWALTNRMRWQVTRAKRVAGS